MKLSIASGKGGTGKTTVATSLAKIASENGRTVAYLDCDVEEPNGHVFLRPELTRREDVTRPVPEIVADKCTHCGLCAEACQYNAVACVGDRTVVFPELCHSCGGCALVCPADAVVEVDRVVGRLEAGRAGKAQFVQGILDVGEPTSPPVIRAVRAAGAEADLVIIDAPPGTSCPMVESVRGSDFVVLVAEPTLFGLHDLQLAVEVVRSLKLPFGVVINRAGAGERELVEYCRVGHIDILARIPDDRRIAEAYSRGEPACDVDAPYAELFRDLLGRLGEAVGQT